MDLVDLQLSHRYNPEEFVSYTGVDNWICVELGSGRIRRASLRRRLPDLGGGPGAPNFLEHLTLSILCPPPPFPRPPPGLANQVFRFSQSIRRPRRTA